MSPTVMILDGDFPTAVCLARELSEDLDAAIVGVGTSKASRLLQSRYCDTGVIVPSMDGDHLVDTIERYRPDFAMPVGYGSAKTIGDREHDLPDDVSSWVPSRRAFLEGADKTTVLEYATELGIDTPTEYTHIVNEADADGRRGTALDAIDFPVFLKPRHETVGGGHESTGRVDDPSAFWEIYDEIQAAAPGDEVLVQECIVGTGSTYGCGILVIDGTFELVFSHEELRSVPRRGGSGTHIRVLDDPALEASSVQLLRELGLEGIALVEYRRRADGTNVLMEVNPKFWASYALASRHGYRFGSEMVASVLDLDFERPEPNPEGEIIFPLRELYYCARHPRDSRFWTSIPSLLTADATWSLDRADLRPWLTPPVDLLKKVPSL